MIFSPRVFFRYKKYFPSYSLRLSWPGRRKKQIFLVCHLYFQKCPRSIVIENRFNHDGFAARPPIYISGDIVAINLGTFFALTSSRVVPGYCNQGTASRVCATHWKTALAFYSAKRFLRRNILLCRIARPAGHIVRSSFPWRFVNTRFYTALRKNAKWMRFSRI